VEGDLDGRLSRFENAAGRKESLALSGDWRAHRKFSTSISSDEPKTSRL
jgi:hypothetical protein